MKRKPVKKAPKRKTQRLAANWVEKRLIGNVTGFAPVDPVELLGEDVTRILEERIADYVREGYRGPVRVIHIHRVIKDDSRGPEGT